MKIHNRGKFHFYSICSCQVINFPTFSWRCSIHEMTLFGGFFGPQLPRILSDLTEICTRGNIQGEENSVSKNFGKFKFLRKLHVTKVCTFFQFLPNFDPILLYEGGQNRKNLIRSGQNLAIGLSKYCKIKVMSCLNFSGKIRLFFALFWLFFAKKRGVVTR